MVPIEWLEHFVSFSELPGSDRDAIASFGLLWSLFECTMVNSYANADMIVKAVAKLHADKRVSLSRISADFVHFQDRYFSAGGFTDKFEDLNFRRNDRRDLVEAVLSGQSKEPDMVLSAILIIVFRLCNNLFYGTKWGYRMQGQRANFEHANNLLMRVMEMHGLQ